jgi:ribosomal protein L30E
MLVLFEQNNMIPTSGEKTEPLKMAISSKSSTVSYTLAGNKRTTKEAKNKPRNQVIIIKAEIPCSKRKKIRNIFDVAEVTSAVFSQGRGVLMKNNSVQWG